MSVFIALLIFIDLYIKASFKTYQSQSAVLGGILLPFCFLILRENLFCFYQQLCFLSSSLASALRENGSLSIGLKI